MYVYHLMFLLRHSHKPLITTLKLQHSCPHCSVNIYPFLFLPFCSRLFLPALLLPACHLEVWPSFKIQLMPTASEKPFLITQLTGLLLIHHTWPCNLSFLCVSVDLPYSKRLYIPCRWGLVFKCLQKYSWILTHGRSSHNISWTSGFKWIKVRTGREAGEGAIQGIRWDLKTILTLCIEGNYQLHINNIVLTYSAHITKELYYSPLFCTKA